MDDSLPREAHENWTRGSVIVLWLLEELLDVLTDGGEVALLALGLNHLVCAVVFLSWCLGLYWFYRL